MIFVHAKRKPKNKQKQRKFAKKKTQKQKHKQKDDSPPADSANKLTFAKHDVAAIQVNIVAKSQDVHLNVKEELN